MLKIKIIVVGRTRLNFINEGQHFYLKRLKRYAHIEWVETRPAKMVKGKSTQGILAEEGMAIAKRLLDRDYVIVLDRTGKAYDSEKLASRIERLTLSQSEIVFIVGGPLGLSNKILDRANEILSLSSLTFTHEMSRLFLLEQLYRAFTILRNEKYHK